MKNISSTDHTFTLTESAVIVTCGKLLAIFDQITAQLCDCHTSIRRPMIKDSREPITRTLQNGGHGRSITLPWRRNPRSNRIGSGSRKQQPETLAATILDAILNTKANKTCEH